jgi:hypothetical protein
VSDTKYTAGPWWAQTDTYGCRRIWAKNPRGEIVDVASCHGDGSIPDEEELANEKLVTAAPEMAEALLTLPFDWFGDDMEENDAADFVDHAAEFFEAIQKGRAALKKAGLL